MDNLEIYNKVRKVPPEAQKPISGGRLNGKTDINPMWRIKTLTEQFGMVGFGWKYEITKQWIEKGSNEEIAAFVNIALKVKMNGEWSEEIHGTGGSMFVAKEKNGLFTSDECFKMALTDAISVACKALGIGADVYWEKDSSKYDRPTGDGNKIDGNKPPLPGELISEAQARRFFALGKPETVKKVLLAHGYTDSKLVKKSDYDTICKEIQQGAA